MYNAWGTVEWAIRPTKYFGWAGHNAIG